MKNKKNFLDYYMSKLEPHGPIRSRAMFGGYGIYYGTYMFACIVENVLYFRIDDENKYDYEPYRSKQFIYKSKTKTISLPYLELPKLILENPEILPEWIEMAKDAAVRYKQAHPKKPKKSKI